MAEHHQIIIGGLLQTTVIGVGKRAAVGMAKEGIGPEGLLLQPGGRHQQQGWDGHLDIR